jgi:hypothetical protein
MLCAKRKFTGEIVTAYFASKAHGPFKCPDCGDEVILKTSRRTVNHFAHVNPLACLYAENESDKHRHCKIEIFLALQKEPHVLNVALEYRDATQGTPFAPEKQPKKWGYQRQIARELFVEQKVRKQRILADDAEA